jgi:hypothetical protein
MTSNLVAPSARRLAIAYLRPDADNEVEIGGLLSSVADCCLRHQLLLVRTITDFGYDGRHVDRPGIMELRQALSDSVGLNIVVPTLNDLSPADCIRSPLVTMIRQLGGTLLVAKGIESAPPAADVTQPEPQPRPDRYAVGRSS